MKCVRCNKDITKIISATISDRTTENIFCPFCGTKNEVVDYKIISKALMKEAKKFLGLKSFSYLASYTQNGAGRVENSVFQFLWNDAKILNSLEHRQITVSIPFVSYSVSKTFIKDTKGNIIENFSHISAKGTTEFDRRYGNCTKKIRIDYRDGELKDVGKIITDGLHSTRLFTNESNELEFLKIKGSYQRALRAFDWLTPKTTEDLSIV